MFPSVRVVFNGSFHEKVESIPLKITSPTLKNGAHRVYLVDGSIIGSNHEVIAFKLWATASHLLKHHFTIEEGCYILTDEGSYKAILVALDDYPAYPNIVAEPCPLPDNYPMHIPRVV